MQTAADSVNVDGKVTSPGHLQVVGVKSFAILRGQADIAGPLLPDPCRTCMAVSEARSMPSNLLVLLHAVVC